jgi:hypothetical protein
MKKPTGSETSAMDPAVHSQDSQEPSEFPPPSPKAYLEILVMNDDKAKSLYWKQILISFFKGQA